VVLLFIFFIIPSILKAEKPVIDSVTINPSPGCTHQNVSYSATGHDPDGGCPGGIKNWFWSFGDGSNSGWISGSATHQYNSYSSSTGYIVTVYACDYNNEISDPEVRNLIIIQDKINDVGHLFPTEKYNKVIITVSVTAGHTEGNLETTVDAVDPDVTPSLISKQHNNTSQTLYVDDFGTFESPGTILGVQFSIYSSYARSGINCNDSCDYEITK